jgi:hypothetical protein
LRHWRNGSSSTYNGVQGSHDGGDKGKKSVGKDSCLVEHESQMKQLSEYPAKARIRSCQVMSVWGIAGVGKSALVKKFYDEKMCYTKLFEEYYWVNVSHTFNLRDFRRSLPPDFHFKESRWLIVIDDIRSKKEWDLIQSSLAMPRSSMSVIIVITTDKSIAAYCANNEELMFIMSKV